MFQRTEHDIVVKKQKQKQNKKKKTRNRKQLTGRKKRRKSFNQHNIFSAIAITECINYLWLEYDLQKPAIFEKCVTKDMRRLFGLFLRQAF